MNHLHDLHAIENGGFLYYKWKAAYLTRQAVANIRTLFEVFQIVLCLLLVLSGVLPK